MNTPCSSSDSFQPGGSEAAAGAAERSGHQPRTAGGTAAAGDPPRLVIRGESSYGEFTDENGEKFLMVLSGRQTKIIALPQPKADGNGAAALVDYLNCSFSFPADTDLVRWFAELFSVLGGGFAPATDRRKGLHGYLHSFALGESSGFFAYGGNGGTGFLTFPGEACHMISDWPGLVLYLRDVLNARITRWDGAVDDYNGGHSVDLAVQMYEAGLFNAGGRQPVIDQRGNWLQPDGRGRTFYVGRRANGKTLRIYEKGMQLGIPFHPWTRWELELHNTDRVIPWDAVLESGKYVAGAYPKALGWISEEQCRIRTLTHTANAGYDSLTHWASVAYGKHIDLMIKVEGSAEKALDRLRREGLPARLDLPPVPGFGKVLPTCER
jgi:phage replication initiation protein